MAPSLEVVICDLDGTLLKSDSTRTFLKYNNLRLFALFPRLIRVFFSSGRYGVKSELSKISPIEPILNSVNVKVLSLLMDHKRMGKRVILVSASNHDFVQRIGNHFGISESFGSTSQIRLKGWRKMQIIFDLIGNANYIYFGDSIHDIPIWQNADTSVIVGPNFVMRIYLLRKLRGRRVEVIY